VGQAVLHQQSNNYSNASRLKNAGAILPDLGSSFHCGLLNDTESTEKSSLQTNFHTLVI
jgi:hypothetical protein